MSRRQQREVRIVISGHRILRSVTDRYAELTSVEKRSELRHLKIPFMRRYLCSARSLILPTLFELYRQDLTIGPSKTSATLLNHPLHQHVFQVRGWLSVQSIKILALWNLRHEIEQKSANTIITTINQKSDITMVREKPTKYWILYLGISSPPPHFALLYQSTLKYTSIASVDALRLTDPVASPSSYLENSILYWTFLTDVEPNPCRVHNTLLRR